MISNKDIHIEMLALDAERYASSRRRKDLEEWQAWEQEQSLPLTIHDPIGVVVYDEVKMEEKQK